MFLSHIGVALPLSPSLLLSLKINNKIFLKILKTEEVVRRPILFRVGLCVHTDAGWRGLHCGRPGSLVALTAARPRGLPSRPDRVAVPTVLGAGAAVGNALCPQGGRDAVGGRMPIVGSDEGGDIHCRRVGSRLGEKAGGRVWRGQLAQVLWGCLDLQGGFLALAWEPQKLLEGL